MGRRDWQCRCDGVQLLASLRLISGRSSDICESISITGSTSLRTLHLHNLDHASFGPLLSQASHLPIRKIILTDSTHTLKRMYDDRNVTIDSIMSSGFHDLEQVCIVLPVGDKDDDCDIRTDWPKVVLPSFESRGMVQMLKATEVFTFSAPFQTTTYATPLTS